MKNLVLQGERRRRLNLDDAPNSAFIASICQVLPRNLESEASTIVLTDNGLVTRLNDNGDILWKRNLEEVDDVGSGGGWFDVSFIDPELVCLSRLGAIVTVDPTTGKTELVGVFDQGLEAASWSPDKEVLLMVTSTIDDDDDNISNGDEKKEPQINSHLMTMNTSFEVLAEITIPKYIPSSTSVDSKISVAWRPDGNFCAVSSVDAEDTMRNVRIYKGETLEPHAIGRSEDASGALVKNLQNAIIAWAGNGCSQLLASVQRKGRKTQQVVFFESNGLRHRDFLLREVPSTVVSSLHWNATSDILAVVLREENGTDKIQLWHRCNYHWYLKREFRYFDRQVQLVKFSKENPHELLVLLHDFEWREYEVRWVPSTTLSFKEKSLAFVVDGSSLKLTDFNRAVIPPPMFTNAYEMGFPINDVTFCKANQNLGSLLIVMSNGDLVLLRCDIQSMASYNQTKVLWDDMKDIDVLALRSFLIVGVEEDKLHIVAFLCASGNDRKDKMVEITISDLGSLKPRSDVTGSFLLDDRLQCAVQWSDTIDGCLLHLHDGSLLEYERLGSVNILPSDVEPLLELCPWIRAIKDSTPYGDSSHLDYYRSRLVFGLSSRSRLYFNDVMLADSASSFILSLDHEFLCYVTAGSRCQVRFLPLKNVHDFDSLMGPEQNYLLEGYEPRNVEQGSRLVAVLPQQPQMILQMPRGNLEGIYPRALALRFVMSRINEGAYSEAFRMMRKHKVDLNLIVDLHPKEFLESGISLFVKQVDVIDHLNLFISNLQNYDVTQSRFPVPTWFESKRDRSKEDPSFDFSTKVNEICRKARSVMIGIEKSGDKPNRYYLLPVLSTFAKEDPPRLDEALSLIKDDALRLHSVKLSTNPLFSDSAQRSIRYLAFLAEYELLFETALGIYDYDIARAVARNSQMDPKMYLPLLKRFNTLPTFFSRYEVDMRLKRFEMALTNLYESSVRDEKLDNFVQIQNLNSNSFDDCMKLIDEHKLYKLGLNLFRENTARIKKILIALGNCLMEEKRPSTALAVFLSTDPPFLDGATRAARGAHDWRCYFSLLDAKDKEIATNHEDYRTERRRQAAREIANEITTSNFSLSTKRQAYSDASRILLDYGDDLIGAVDCLTTAEVWSEGYRIANLHSRQDLMNKCIDSATGFAQTSLDTFVERVEEFKDANMRYAEVLKLRKQTVYLEGPEQADEAEETGSLFSAASNASNTSLQSNMSSSSACSNMSRSSVISVKSVNTFSMTGEQKGDRHRSKFNKGKKQKKRNRKRKPKKKRGSEEELQGLIGMLKSSCPDSYYAATITETIKFLVVVQKLPLAQELFNAYNCMSDSIEESKVERIKIMKREKAEAELLTRSEGNQHELNHFLVDIPSEKIVDALSCSQLAISLSQFFGLLSNN